MGPTVRQALTWLGLVRPKGTPRPRWYANGPAWYPVSGIVAMLLLIGAQLVDWHGVRSVVLVMAGVAIMGGYVAMFVLRRRDRRRGDA